MENTMTGRPRRMECKKSAGMGQQEDGNRNPPQKKSSPQKLLRDKREMDLFSVSAYNRNGISHRQHINILALPKLEKSKPARPRNNASNNRAYIDLPMSNAHLDHLARPRNHYLLDTLRDHKEILPMSRLGSIIKHLSSNKAITPQQATKQYEDLLKLKQKLKSPIKIRKMRLPRYDTHYIKKR